MKILDELLDEIIINHVNDNKRTGLITELKETTIEYLKQYLVKRLTEIDEIFSKRRKNKNEIIIAHSKQPRVLLTEIGDIKYKRNHYKDKKNNKYFYFIDNLLGINKHERIELDLKKEIIKNSVDFTYHKASKMTDNLITSQTAFNLVKKNYNKFITKNCKDKMSLRFIDHLQIEADEDHVHMKDNTNKQARLIYVHEGYEKINGRYILKNPKYFSSMQNNENLWEKVKKYVKNNYSLNTKITIHGDGAKWIKQGLDYFKYSDFYLDKFHVMQTVRRISGGNKEKQNKLINAIINQDISYIEELYKKRYKKEYKSEKLIYTMQGLNYILNNFYNIEFQNKAVKCSAESHISHILSARLSSRPMAWSYDGANRITKLRAYKYNKGDYIEIYSDKNNMTTQEEIKIEKSDLFNNFITYKNTELQAL